MRRPWSRQPSESESADGENTRECSWDLMRTLDSPHEEAPTHDELDADTTSLYRSAVTSLNYWAVDRLDMQYAVIVLQVHVEPMS